DHGHLHCGPPGAGHFVKMIHNGIEYGMMQAYAEGFALLENKREFDLDIAAIAQTWRHGSVIRSWLLDLTAEFLHADAELGTIGRALATSLGWHFHDADDFHPPANVAKMAAGIALTDDDRWPWLDRIVDALAHAGADGANAVLACSALRQSYRERLTRAGNLR